MTTREAVRFWFVALACAGACAPLAPGARAAGRTTVPAPGSPRSIGLLVDVRPQQRSVLDFERRTIDAVAAGLADAASRGFAIAPIRGRWIGAYAT